MQFFVWSLKVSQASQSGLCDDDAFLSFFLLCRPMHSPSAGRSALARPRIEATSAFTTSVLRRERLAKAKRNGLSFPLIRYQREIAQLVSQGRQRLIRKRSTVERNTSAFNDLRQTVHTWVRLKKRVQGLLSTLAKTVQWPLSFCTYNVIRRQYFTAFYSLSFCSRSLARHISL